MNKLVIKYESKLNLSKAGLVVIFAKKEITKNEIEELCGKYNLKIPATDLKSLADKKLNSLSSFDLKSSTKLRFIKADYSKINIDYFRNKSAELVANLTEELSELKIILPGYDELKEIFETEEDFIQSAIEGLYLGNYNFDKYLSEKKNPRNIKISLTNVSKKSFDIAFRNAEAVAEAVYFSRDIINEPANELTPKELAKRVKARLSKEKVKVTVFGKRELEKRKMTALLAVSRASTEEPQFIVMEHKPRAAKKKIVLVGKGLTYDSGGLSLKPTEGMFDMKIDMAGGGAVIGAVLAAALTNLPVHVIGIVPAVENMIGGNSYKPGDIIKTSTGKSIEVKNTDAEGRIVLADAIEYANKLKPDFMIDLATLTGACVVALGEHHAGLFTNNNKLADLLLQSGKNTYERVWQLPLTEDYDELLKSDIADISNLGPRWGGAITAAKFIEFFVDKKENWAHIDIAGPAGKNKLTSYTKDYHTAFGVRLLWDFLRKQ